MTERPVRPCLVYVAGLRGPEAQVWHDPMVTEAGKPAIKPEGIEITDCFQLPALELPWTVNSAEAYVLRTQKAERNRRNATP